MSQTKAQLISDLVQALNFTGTSSAPANGAFLSAANTLALATNSAQRLTIDSSGRVGIGTTSPAVPLHVQKSGTSENLLTLESDLGSNNNRTLIIGGPTSDSTTAPFRFTTGNSLSFVIDSTSALDIDSSGNVGIGTASPTGTLSLSDQNPNIRFDDEDTSNNGEITLDNTQLRIEVDEDNAVNNSAIKFRIDNSDKAIIDSSGRLGIGTTSPNTKLDVRDSGGTGISSRSTSTQATDSNKGLRVRNNSDTDTFSVSYKGEGYFAGRLGIGESDPAVSIHVKESSPRIHLEDTGTNAIFRINADSSVGNAALDVDIDSDTSTPSLIVNIQGNEKMRLGSSGRLGIGTSSPSQLMELASTAPNIRLTDTVDGHSEVDGNAASLRFIADKGNAKSGTTITFLVDNSEKVRINSDGHLLINNTTASLSIGDSGAILAGSNGIHTFARNAGTGSAVLWAKGGSGQAYIVGDGDLLNTNGNYDAISDQKLKENIIDANSQWNDIKAVKVRNYNFKKSTNYSTHKQLGVIAQELEASGMNGLIKEIDDIKYVEGDELPEGKNIGDVKEEGYKAVSYSVLYMKALKALQEAMAKIETLETKVAALEAA